MALDDFELSYASIPFVLDNAQAVRMTVQGGTDSRTSPKHEPPRKYQPEADLIDELNRRIPFDKLNEFAPPKQFLKGSMSMLAYPYALSYPDIKIGEFFYPNNAARWSCGRFLATSQQVKKMLAKAVPASGPTPQTFIMQSTPVGAGELDASEFKIETPMYMLPPRPLAEHGSEFDGLFLVTLVDERWYWQWKPTNLRPYDTTTWSTLIQDLLDALDISATYEATSIPSTYLQPAQDSQLWTSKENAAQLLDIALRNIGRTLVRKLDGSYVLMDGVSSVSQIETNRADGDTVIQLAGGDMFYAGTKLPSGKKANSSTATSSAMSLLNAPDTRRLVLPKEIVVCFPLYVTGDDPVPHSLNPRYRPRRPSCWYEPKPGECYTKTVESIAGQSATLVGTHFIHTTAKAYLDTQNSDITVPTNQSTLDTLATQLAGDYIDSIGGSALDEVYPGTFVWEPEGLQDIIWTYSAKKRQASTRVMRQEWNELVREFQHAESKPPKGVGGPSVAQSWILTGTSGAIETTAFAVASGDYTVTFKQNDNFPTANRWRGVLAPGGVEERILFEASSGGVAFGVVHRAIDGTSQIAHASGVTVRLTQNEVQYGVNVVHTEKMQWLYPGIWSSGGISEVVVKPQTQTVQVLAASGAIIKSLPHWSGRLKMYDTTKSSGTQYPNGELIWIIERNLKALSSGIQYDGQFVGHSASGPVAPVYLVNDPSANGKIGNFRDSYSGGVTTTITATGMASGDLTADFTGINNLPTQNRWRGQIDDEIILFEGTSGGSSTIGIVHRGFDGTAQVAHVADSIVDYLDPDAMSGYNRITLEKMAFAFHGQWSGCNNEVRIVPQTQTVQGLGSGYTMIRGIRSYSGRVLSYDATKVSGAQFPSQESIWIQERNNWEIASGRKYDGQFVGWSASGSSGGSVAPLYVVNAEPVYIREARSGGYGSSSGWHGPYQKLTFVVSGVFASGQASMDIETRGFPESGAADIYFTISGVAGAGGATAVGAKSVKVELPYYSGTDNLIPASANHKIGWSGEIYDTDTIFPGNAGNQFYFIPRTSGKYAIKGHLALDYSGVEAGQIMQVILTVNDISYEEQSWVAYSGRFTVHSSVCGDHWLGTSSRVSINVLNGLDAKPVAGYFMMHQFAMS